MADLGFKASCVPSHLARLPHPDSLWPLVQYTEVWEPHASVFSAASLPHCALLLDVDFPEPMAFVQCLRL